MTKVYKLAGVFGPSFNVAPVALQLHPVTPWTVVGVSPALAKRANEREQARLVALGYIIPGAN